jgi:hypothetical protein
VGSRLEVLNAGSVHSYDKHGRQSEASILYRMFRRMTVQD